jgi:hypothetical protein
MEFYVQPSKCMSYHVDYLVVVLATHNVPSCEINKRFFFCWLVILTLFWCLQVVLKATCTQLNKERMLEEVHCIEDLPSLKLLCTSHN